MSIRTLVTWQKQDGSKVYRYINRKPGLKIGSVNSYGWKLISIKDDQQTFNSDLEYMEWLNDQIAKNVKKHKRDRFIKDLKFYVINGLLFTLLIVNINNHTPKKD